MRAMKLWCILMCAFTLSVSAKGYGQQQRVNLKFKDVEVRALFDTMGVTVVFDEEHMLNEVIPYAGSAPAYLYTFADAMIQSAVQHGISEDDALTLFCQTMIGSAKMLLQRDKTPAELIRAVCSPGGTTIEAMKVLEARGLYDILAEASDKCIARAYELGK